MSTRLRDSVRPSPVGFLEVACVRNHQNYTDVLAQWYWVEMVDIHNRHPEVFLTGLLV